MRVMKRVAIALLALVLLAVVAGAAIAWSQGYRLYAVQSGSMSPTFPTGSLVVDGPPAADGGAHGEVITFKIGDGLVTHRVVESSPTGLTTKGDANATDDPWTISQENVVGQVVAAVPRLGYVLVFFKQPSGVLAVVTGLWTMIMLWKLFFPPAKQESASSETPPEPTTADLPPAAPAPAALPHQQMPPDDSPLHGQARIGDPRQQVLDR